MTASQRAYGGRRTAQGGEVDASTVIARSMTEKQLQASVEELARLLDWLVYHTYDSRRSAPGFPDLVMVRDDLLIFAELKREDGYLSEAQKQWRDALSALPIRGARTVAYVVWRPSDWLSGEVERVLRGEG